MSAAAREWLDRQRIEGATLNLILRVLADAADKDGRVNLSQTAIGNRAGLCERACRRAITTFDQAGVITRTRRSEGGRNGRAVDLIHLDLAKDFVLSKEAIGALKSLGATGTKLWGQPARNAGAPTASRVGYIKYTDLHGRIHHCSGRIWIERDRQKWRSQICVDKVSLTLGRFDTDKQAMGALRGALADIEYNLGNKSSGIRDKSAIRSDVQFTDISELLPGDFSSAWRARYSYEGSVI